MTERQRDRERDRQRDRRETERETNRDRERDKESEVKKSNAKGDQRRATPPHLCPCRLCDPRRSLWRACVDASSFRKDSEIESQKIKRPHHAASTTRSTCRAARDSEEKSRRENDLSPNRKKKKSVSAPFPNFETAMAFRSRIMERQRRWWGVNGEKEKPKEGVANYHTGKECLQTRSSPWKCCPLWQRKLKDKTLSRLFVSRLGIAVPSLLWQGTNADAIPLETLAASGKPYVVKASLGTVGENVFVMSRGRDALHKQKPVSSGAIRTHLAAALRREPAACILVERAQLDWNWIGPELQLPTLFRFYMTGDQIDALCIHHPVSSTWYDAGWRRLPFAVRHQDHAGQSVTTARPLPPLDAQRKLSECARTIGRAYGASVRCDLFLTQNGPVFNEFSHSSAMGLGFTAKGQEYLARRWKT